MTQSVGVLLLNNKQQHDVNVTVTQEGFISFVYNNKTHNYIAYEHALSTHYFSKYTQEECALVACQDPYYTISGVEDVHDERLPEPLCIKVYHSPILLVLVKKQYLLDLYNGSLKASTPLDSLTKKNLTVLLSQWSCDGSVWTFSKFIRGNNSGMDVSLDESILDEEISEITTKADEDLEESLSSDNEDLVTQNSEDSNSSSEDQDEEVVFSEPDDGKEEVSDEEQDSSDEVIEFE